MLLPYIILPPLHWFVLGCQQQQFPILLNAPFIKQNGANRYHIAAPNNIQPLTIPVHHEDRNRPLPQVRINYNQNWIKDHKQAWQTAYGKSPFFEYYDYRFFAVFDEQPQTMQHIIHGLNQVLFQNLKLPFTPEYIAQPNAESSLIAQNALLPYHQQQINPIPYTQTFHTKFGFRAPVSAIDLLFNLGPLAPEYLAQYNPTAII